MTDLERQAALLFQLISEEADDYGADRITRSTSLRRDLNLSGVQRIALLFRVEAEFSTHFTEAEYEAITSHHATVADVWRAVERSLSANKETTT